MNLPNNLSTLLTPAEQAQLLQQPVTHYDAFLGVDNDIDACYPEAATLEEIPAPTDDDAPVACDAYGDPTDAQVTHYDAFLGLDSANTAPPDVTHCDAFLGLDTDVDVRYPNAATLETPPPPTDENARPPRWLLHTQKGKEIQATDFVEDFIAEHQVQCVGGRFYLGDKSFADDMLKNHIYQTLNPYIKVSAQRINSLFSLMSIISQAQIPEPCEESIYFKNCTINILKKQAAPTQHTVYMQRTKPEKICFCRVPHCFDATAGEPVRFLAFLNELFEAEDIPTVQQYLGYCMLPTTKAQKALFIIGKGGEGKSRLTWLMQKVLGDACSVSSVARIGEKFFGVTLENCLVYIDDDVSCEKFKSTDVFKTLVTNETQVLVEPKGKAHYKAHPYAKFLLMGNQSVGSLHDRSEGFYRRVHIVNTKPRNPNRVHNPNLIQDIWAAEQAEILLWLVKGALQLARQNYRLSESDASRAALKELRRSDNSAIEFLQEQSFVYDASYSITSQQLNSKYREWCYDNDMFKMGGQAFKQTCEQYFGQHGAEYRNSVKVGQSLVRGYAGVQYSTS